METEIRCVVLDIDGTLLNSAEELSQRNRAAVRAVQARGIPVTLATGRRLVRTLPWIQALNIIMPVVIHNGAVIYDPVSRTVTHKIGMELDLVAGIIDDLRASGFHFVVYTGESAGDGLQMEQNLWETGRHLLQRYVGDGVDAVDVHRFAEPPLKVAMVAPVKELEPHLPRWQERYGQSTNMMVFHSLDGLYTGVEFIAPGVSKAAAAKQILRSRGIRLAEALCIGDDVNDKELIEQAGWGIAMANGDPRVRQVAKHITAANDDDGVAQALEDYIL